MPPRRSTRGSNGSSTPNGTVKDEPLDTTVGSSKLKGTHVAVSGTRARSKLATEKTTSADNLTLNSRAVKVEVEIDMDVDVNSDAGDTDVDKPVTRRRRAVSSDDEDDFKPKSEAMDVDSQSEHDVNVPTPRRQRKARAPSESEEDDYKPATNGRAKGKARATKKRRIDPDSDEDATESDENKPPAGARANGTKRKAPKAESKPPRRATWVTVRDGEDPNEFVDDDDSDNWTNGDITPKAGSSTSSTPSTRRSRKNETPHRTAIARAVERRLRGDNSSPLQSSPGETLSTPAVSGATTPLGYDFSPSDSDEDDTFTPDRDSGSPDSPITVVESDSELSAVDSEEDIPLSKRKKGKSTKKSFRLDGESADELPEDWDTKKKGKKGRAKKAAPVETAEKKVIRKRQTELQKKLGRKLTQGERNAIRLAIHHPELEDAWGDLEANVEPVAPVPMEAHPSLKLTLLPFQKESLYWMKEQEKGPWRGGMLADEMGMGKTIQTIALLLSEPRNKPSLVVAPVVALMQWKHEIETHAEGFSVCLWHGAGRQKVPDLKKFDVVLVSYGTLEASFRRQQNGFKKGNLIVKEKSPMHAFEWYRVVLDEAHNIKERSTNSAKAAFALQARYRWCLSGTPLQNRVGELYSLVRFLGADPFSFYFCKKCDCKSLHWKFSNRRHCDDCGHKPMDHVSLWNSEILTPIARYGVDEKGPGKTAFKKLKILLDRMMLRRTKLERADDLGLPPRTIEVRRDFFSPPEKELYQSLFTNAKRQFNTYLDQGTVLNNYSNIFSLITRMRQMACHPDLVLRSKTSTLAQPVTEGSVCRLCNDAAEDAIVSACKHVFDRECIKQYLEVQQLRGHRPECPVCHIEISIDLEQEAVDLGESGKQARQGILSRLDLDNWRSSSKLEALVEELEKLRKKDCTIKSLVFSQFVSFLDLIAFRLQRAGFNICRLEGGMTPQQRDATIQHFMNNTGVTVFLISLKAGGVALNLTEASMVFMMDSWWNPSVEYQAMDRIHRLGQKRPVRVVKLVVEDSIEDQIVKLQHKKLAMTDAALSRDPDAALGKLTVEDLGFLFKL